MWWGDDGVSRRLTAALTASSLRQRVIAHNLANFNTPGFKRYAVSFEDEVKRAAEKTAIALRRSSPDHLGPPDGDPLPRVKADRCASERADGNNVQLEGEMVSLVTNQLRYSALIQQMNSRFSRWRSVINEGRR